jgi:hypothetical protein
MSLCECYCLGDVFIATLVRVGQLYLNLVDYGLTPETRSVACVAAISPSSSLWHR